MIARLLSIPAISVLGIALLSGCVPVADQVADGEASAHDESSASVPLDSDAGDDDTVDAGATVPFPHITSCDQVAAAAPDIVQAMPLIGDSIADDGVLCQWAAPDDGPFASVTVSASTDIPTSDALKLQSKMLRMTPTSLDDPRLAAANGVAIRWTTDGSAGAPGYSIVYVPGLSVELHRGAHDAAGPQSYAPDDRTTVSAALQILAL